tara:strand:- start:22975 stop:24087 length:1113 start_codon:yes stop_codon:yes gene_type:complete
MTNFDEEINRAAEREEIIETKELKRAYRLISHVDDSIYNFASGPRPVDLNNREIVRPWMVDLIRAGRLIHDAKKHHERVKELANKLYRDIRNLRNPPKGETITGFLTQGELDTLSLANNLAADLSKIMEEYLNTLKWIGSGQTREREVTYGGPRLYPAPHLRAERANRRFKSLPEILDDIKSVIDALHDLLAIEKKMESYFEFARETGQEAKREEVIETRELMHAKQILTRVHNFLDELGKPPDSVAARYLNNPAVYKPLGRNLEIAARLVADTNRHHKHLSELAERIYRALSASLTEEEIKTLRLIYHHMRDKLSGIVDELDRVIKSVGSGHSYSSDVRSDLLKVLPEIDDVIYVLDHFKSIERKLQGR